MILADHRMFDHGSFSRHKKEASSAQIKARTVRGIHVFPQYPCAGAHTDFSNPVEDKDLACSFTW